MKEITCEISIQRKQLSGDLSISRKEIQGDLPGDLIFGVPGKDAPTYDGPYAVTPSLNEQMLETAQKMMSDNVTVKEIPIYVVSNNSGGTTVIIGG